MKKNLKVIGLIYLMIGVFTYVLTLRVDRLEGAEDYQNQNQSIVLSVK